MSCFQILSIIMLLWVCKYLCDSNFSSTVCVLDIEYTKLLDNHDGVGMNLEPDILECEVKWALESITTNKASGGHGIPVELFQILKDDAVKVLYSTCQQIWKTRQWPQDWKSSVFIPIRRKAMSENVQTTAQLHSFYMLAK